MSTSEHYDVIIVGRSVAGLLTAALLSKRRFRVRVFDVEDAHHGPICPLFGMNTSPIWQKLVEELGLIHTMRTQLRGTRGVGIALDDRRFVLHPERGARGEELGECFPDETEGLLRLFEHAAQYGPMLTPLLEGEMEGPPTRFGRKRKWKRHVEMHQLSASIPTIEGLPAVVENLFSAVLSLAGHFNVTPNAATPAQWRTFWHLCHGEQILEGGQEHLESLLIERIESTGGVYEKRKKVRRLEVRRKKIRGIQLIGGDVVGADYYVLANGARDLENLVDEWPDPERWVHWSRGALQTNPTTQKAPFVGWKGSDTPSATSHIVNGEYWLSTLSKSPTKPESFIGALWHGENESGSYPNVDNGRLDDFGLYHADYEDPFKNGYFVGDWVIPGLGLEAAGLTAWQTTQAITDASSGFFRSGPRR